MKKPISIRMNYNDYISMSENGELNSEYLTSFLNEHIDKRVNTLVKIDNWAITHTFRCDDDLRRKIKLKAIDEGMSVLELTHRIIYEHYEVK